MAQSTLLSARMRRKKTNWIKTVPGKGWFPIFRFYSPTEPFFDKTWKLEDIAEAK